MQQNAEVLSQWSGSAPYWEKHREIIREMFAPVTQALVEDAQIRGGSTVLDVATGPGEPALTVAGLVEPDGRVVGIDLVPEMVEAARRESGRRGLRNASFETAFAESLPFAANTFNAVVSRFGIMFFPAPADAIREWLRVLKPDGRLALAVWHDVEKNPFFSVVSRVVEKFGDPVPSPSPDSPDAFRFSDSGKLQAVLENAGVAEISERRLQFSIRASISVEEFWTLRYEMSEKLRARIALLSKQKRDELKRAVIAAFSAYSSNGEIIFPSQVLIVSGKKGPV